MTTRLLKSGGFLVPHIKVLTQVFCRIASPVPRGCAVVEVPSLIPLLRARELVHLRWKIGDLTRCVK